VRVDPDPWLGGILGYQVFRVTVPKVSQRFGSEDHSLEKAFDTAGQGRAFYYAKAPTLSVAHVKEFARAGFTVVDVNVTFSRGPGAIENKRHPEVNIMDIEPGEQEAVLKIAESSFVYSRFHLDPQIDNESANAIKREWVRNYIRGNRGERLLVAKCDGVPAGFLAILSNEDGAGTRIRVIDLIAVSRSYQGRGIGKSLVDFFVFDSREAYAKLEVGTQIANLPSMALYQKCGFHISDSAYVLHAHLWNRKLQ